MQYCKVCFSPEIATLGQLKPYEEYEWKFNVFQCNKCRSRFTQRDAGVNYHELLHTMNESPYGFHYANAEYIKKHLCDLQCCENFLRKRPIIATVLDFLQNLPKDAKILEVGSSSGYVVAYLRALGYKYAVGVDVSPSAIAAATKLFGEFYFESIDESTKFDLIFHSGVIGCVDAPQNFLKFYLQKLSQKGCMIFNAPNVRSPQELNELWVDTPPPDLITLFDKKFFQKFSKKGKYNVQCKEIGSFTLSQQKYKAKLFGNDYVRYPISLKQTPRNYTALDKILYTTLFYADKMKILKRYCDEYGLVVEMTSL